MGLLDVFKRKKKDNFKGAITSSGNLPYSYNALNSVYACDLIIQAIHCKQNEFQKIKPKHVVVKDGLEVVDVSSSINKVLKRPNAYMTTADFFSKIVFLREINQNAYIYPEYFLNNSGKKVFTALYPLNPRQVQYLADESGTYFIKMTFNNGYEPILPLQDVIHWRKNYDEDDYFGGNNRSNTDLLDFINQYRELCDSIAVGVSCSCKINGLVKVNGYLDDEKMVQDRINFEQKLKANESGILFTDLKTEYVPLTRDVKLVDTETLNFFYDSILRNTGTPKEILSGKFDKATKESWYERVLEADITSLAQAMEKVFFSEREDAFGNRIILYPSNIVFMSMENKIAALQIGLPAGIFTKDESRELLGYPPLPNGAGNVIPQGYNSLLNGGNENLLQNNEGEANE